MSDFTLPGSRSQCRPPLKERVSSTTPKVFNANATALPTPPSATIFQIGGQDATSTRITFDGFGTGISPNLILRAARGTAAKPTAVQSADTLGVISGFGYGATTYSSGSRAQVRLTAAENWTDSSQGTSIGFSTTPTGSTTQATNASIDGTGSLTLSGSAPNIQFTNATSQWIQWPASAFAAPAFTTRSTGTKLMLYPLIDASHCDYAIGIESGTMWSSVPDTTAQFKWYGGTTNVMKLTGTGILTMSGTGSAVMEIGSALLSTGDTVLRLGPNRTGSANAYIDFFADNSGSQIGRIIRNSGANGTLDIYNYGTGHLQAVFNNNFKWFGNTTPPPRSPEWTRVVILSVLPIGLTPPQPSRLPAAQPITIFSLTTMAT